jgi:glycosyltransferase involved in cell wall biosynthesis
VADRSVLFLAPEPLRESLTGPARRTVKLAEVVARHCAVTLAAPSPSVFPGGPFRTQETGPVDDQALAPLFAAHDVVVVQSLPSPRQLLAALRHARRLVVDLVAPRALEAREIGPDDGARRSAVRWREREMVAHLHAADLVLCANERQRDLYVGAWLASGRVGDDRPAGLDESIVVVAQGIDPGTAPLGRSTLRTGELAGADLRIALWAGGMWSWLDPLTAVRAMHRLRDRRPDLRLALVGLEHPDHHQVVAHARVADEAVGYVDRHGLQDTVVVRPPWLAHDEYRAHLADADVGISLHHATLESRYASRTRVVDYLEAGLPVVASDGDAMAELVARHGLGRVVAPGDADGCAAALDALTGPDARRLDAGGALAGLRWDRVAQPLVDYCTDGRPPARRSRASALALTARQYPAFVGAVRHGDGHGGLARAAVRRARAYTRAMAR